MKLSTIVTKDTKQDIRYIELLYNSHKYCGYQSTSFSCVNSECLIPYVLLFKICKRCELWDRDVLLFYYAARTTVVSQVITATPISIENYFGASLLECMSTLQELNLLEMVSLLCAMKFPLNLDIEENIADNGVNFIPHFDDLFLVGTSCYDKDLLLYIRESWILVPRASRIRFLQRVASVTLQKSSFNYTHVHEVQVRFLNALADLMNSTNEVYL